MSGCMAASHPGVHEHQLAAAFEHACKAGGAARMAYPPVVAGGPDACTIHYSRNDKARPRGMPAGCCGDVALSVVHGPPAAALPGRAPCLGLPPPTRRWLATACSRCRATRCCSWTAAASITATPRTSPAPGLWAAASGVAGGGSRGAACSCGWRRRAAAAACAQSCGRRRAAVGAWAQSWGPQAACARASPALLQPRCRLLLPLTLHTRVASLPCPAHPTAAARSARSTRRC